jgi:hypothetical protein
LIQKIAQNDPNLRVRDAARRALEAYGGRQSFRESLPPGEGEDRHVEGAGAVLVG